MKILDYAVARKLGIAFSGGAPSLTTKLIAQKLGGGSGGESGGNTGGGSGSGGGTLPDKNTWEGVFARMDAGTYATDYAIGDTVPLDLGSEGVINMQIAAFDADDLADGTGKAKISWVSKELVGEHRINPYLSGTTEGTGTIGGWGSCELRTYLKDTIKPLIADTVASRIATVTKTQRAYNTDVSQVTQTTEDDVWIPDYNEVFSSGIYTGLFVDNASRIKLARSGSAYYWWTRFAHTREKAICVGKDGAWQSAYTYEPYGIALGFCTN